MMDGALSEEDIQDVFAWIDSIPLSRPKRNISRDFSDGVMAAEVVKHFFPRMVDLHNYVPAHCTQLKISNWKLLNRKVFRRLNFLVPDSMVEKIAVNTAGVIFPVLRCLQEKINLLRLKTEHAKYVNYYDTQNQQDGPDTHLTKAGVVPQLVEMNTDEGKRHAKSKPQRAADVTSDKKPAFKEKWTEKEPSVVDLQQTVEILQMKVSRLEHLLHLKDQRIEDLLRQLEVYKGQKHST